MSWNECLYRYHKAHGGQFLAGECDDAMLIFTWKDRPLLVGIHAANGGRYGPYLYIQARVPVTLGKPYELTVGAEKALSGGVNAVLKATSGIAGFSADYGCPEVTQKRLIRAENRAFTKLVLGSLDFRNALLACPGEKVEVRPGPGDEGLHLLTVTTDATLNSGSWCLGCSSRYIDTYSEEEKLELSQKAETEFFPRMDRFLDLTKAAYNAVTQWPM